MSKRVIGMLVALALVAVACGSRVDSADGGTQTGVATDPTTSEATATEPTTSETGGETAGDDTSGGDPDGPPTEVDLTDDWFGDLPVPCGPTPEGMTLTGGQDQGVSAEAVEIAVIADVQGPRPGLNKEGLDGTTAFVDWCNDLGGVNGRTLNLTFLDSELLQFPARAEEACGFAFAVVGTSAVLDDVGAQTLVDCDMVHVPGYTVSDKAALADRMVQSNPNPTDTALALSGRLLAEQDPEGVKKAAILTGDFPTTKQQRDRMQESFEHFGWEFVYSAEHAVNEQNWGPFVADMKDADVDYIVHVTEPAETSNLLREMVKQGMDLDDVTFVHNPNYYDAEYLELAGENARGQILDMSYIPFEESADYPAAEEFVQILAEYGGYEPSLLAVQAFSSSLLFAVALEELGDDLTREALLAELEAVDSWTAGGITGDQDPGANVRSPCAVSLRINDTGTGYERVFPEDEGFDCTPENVVALSGDFMGATAGG
jgi:ABC-type branched-subunit amino acid transport system substrate-binding protein